MTAATRGRRTMGLAVTRGDEHCCSGRESVRGGTRYMRTRLHAPRCPTGMPKRFAAGRRRADASAYWAATTNSAAPCCAAAGFIHMTCQPCPLRSKKLREYMKPWSSGPSASTPPAASAAAATVSTSSRVCTLKLKSASACVVGSAIGRCEYRAKVSWLPSMTLACSPTTMQAAVSPEKLGSKVKPSAAKNALLRWRSATGMVTNRWRAGWADVVTADLQVDAGTGTTGWTGRARETHRWAGDPARATHAAARVAAPHGA